MESGIDDALLEPLDGYKRQYRAQFQSNAEAYFEELVKKSGISVEQNRSTVAAYNAKLRKVRELDALLSRNRGARTFLIILIVLGFCLIAAAIYLFLPQNESYLLGGILLALGIASVVVGFGVIFGKLNGVIRHAEEERAKRQTEADALLKEAWAQMAPLNALFEDGVTRRLIEKTVPLLCIDQNFNMRRYAYLQAKYGFGDPDSGDCSTIGILTGEILGNPFVVDRELVHTLGTYTYTGSLLITWTTTEMDSEGHIHTVTHSQTLYASLTKPKPYYSERTRLIYGNEAAPNLSFSRNAGHAEALSEQKREKRVKAGAKKIRKLQEIAMTDDDPSTNFTEMGNPEFDVLFGALDRDNEVEFRLLFTPLAQKNMIALLTDPAGFGDDFSFRKRGCLNYISSEHSASWELDTGYRRYYSYSVEDAKNKFVDFNCRYFKSLYFELAPLLSIPLYQQHKPHEFLYPESYPRNYTPYESEYIVNKTGQRAFCHPKTATDAILKTEFLGKEGESDRIRVTAYSYRTENRLDFIPELGGDGHIHQVPVEWVEYIPVVQSTTAQLKELGLTEKQFDTDSSEGSLKEALARLGAPFRGYGHGILCCTTDSPMDEILSQIKK